MAYLYRVALLLLLLFAHVDSHASFPPAVSDWRNGDSSCGGNDAIGVIRCTLSKIHNTTNWGACTIDSQTLTEASGGCVYLGNGVRLITGIFAVLSCPMNSTMQGSVCVCNAGANQVGNTCVVPTPADNAKAIADGLNLIGAPLCFSGAPSLKTCYAGYVISAGFGGSAGTSGGSAQSCIYPPFSGDGTTCVDSPDTSGTPSPCAVGKVPGTVNGVTVCVDPGTTSASGGSSSGSSSSTDGEGNSTGSGSSSSGKETTCTGTTCTTTTTTTTTNSGGGTSTATTSTTQPKATFCAENPASQLCTVGSFSGSCGAAPACSGDAVQCAQARYVFEAACSLAKPSSDSSELSAYNAARLTNDGDQTEKLGASAPVAIGAGNFDQTELLGAGAGLSDLQIEVWGRSVVLPFSNVNPWLSRLGILLQAVTFLLCMRIVFRG